MGLTFTRHVQDGSVNKLMLCCSDLILFAFGGNRHHPLPKIHERISLPFFLSSWDICDFEKLLLASCKNVPWNMIYFRTFIYFQSPELLK